MYDLQMVGASLYIWCRICPIRRDLLMILKCLSHKPLPVYGKGLNERDWLYVTDHCEDISCVIEQGKVGETYNIGGHNEIRNIDIVNTICELLDEMQPLGKLKTYKELITYMQDRSGHDLRYAMDADKIKRDLDWLPKENFQACIGKTIRWYLDHQDWWQNIKSNKYQQERLGMIP